MSHFQTSHKLLVSDPLPNCERPLYELVLIRDGFDLLSSLRRADDGEEGLASRAFNSLVVSVVNLNIARFDVDDDDTLNYCISILREDEHYSVYRARIIEARDNLEQRARDRNALLMSEAAKLLPGYRQKVKNPVDDTMEYLSETIISLNDEEHWSREKIADWLDKLHDDGTLDLSFADRTEENKDCQTRRSENN